MTVSMVAGQDVAIRTTTSLPIDVTLPAPPTAGNLLVASYTSNVATGGSLPAGWTTLVTGGWAGSGPNFVGIYMRQAGASESATVTYTPVAGSSNELHVTEFAGLTTPTLDSSGTADSGTATVTTQSSGTTGPLAGTGDLLYAAMFCTSSTNTPAVSNGFTLLVKAPSAPRTLAAWKQASGQGAQSTDFSWASAAKAAAAIVAISPVAISVSPSGFTGWGVPIA